MKQSFSAGEDRTTESRHWWPHTDPSLVGWSPVLQFWEHYLEQLPWTYNQLDLYAIMNQQWPHQEDQNPRVFFIIQNVNGTSLWLFKTSLFGGAMRFILSSIGSRDTQTSLTAPRQEMKDSQSKQTYKLMSSVHRHVAWSRHVPTVPIGTSKKQHFQSEK
jgi:hypothetical protein